MTEVTVAQLRELIAGHPDDMKVIVSDIGETFHLVDDSATMHFVSKTGELYLEAENAKKDGKSCEEALVLWIVRTK